MLTPCSLIVCASAIYFPQGTHIHQKPLERLESQQGNVDWLRFWLQGYEDPDPSKADQYKRWRVLKVVQDAIEAKAKTEKDKAAAVN